MINEFFKEYKIQDFFNVKISCDKLYILYVRV